MNDLTPPQFMTRADGSRIAFRRVGGSGPTIIFLPGYKSDMQGSKALALEMWAIRVGRAFLRFDYTGCGESDGAFADQTLASWRDDVIGLIEQTVRGPVVLVGSSMGGWLMLHVAFALGAQVVGMIGIAAAPDFTDWGYSSEDKREIEKHGRIEQHSPYSPEPTVTTHALWLSGQAMLVLKGSIDIHCPVRLLQGQCDDDVPWETALRLAALLRSDDVQTVLVKDGDHRLSRDCDIALLRRVMAELLESI
jgi:pimeloyl-ACP methyl ester carboxylesterase